MMIVEVNTTDHVDIELLSKVSDHEQELFSKKVVSNTDQQVFSDDICFEIISMLDDSCFILNNCALISKQFLNLIKERSKLVIRFETLFTPQRIELLMKSQFINNIVNLKWTRIGSLKEVKAITKMKQLKSLDICENRIGYEKNGAKLISEMKQLTLLNIGFNQIGDEGAKFISELKHLTYLDIRNNLIGVEGAKSIGEMKQLTLLYMSENEIGDEGVEFISM